MPYEIHIRLKDPDDPNQIAGMVPDKQFNTRAEIRNYLKRILGNLEVWVLDAETQEVIKKWKAGELIPP